MFARALSAVILSAAALSLAACSPPMSAAGGFEDSIAEGLGRPEQPLASGLYRVTGVTEGGETMPFAALLAEAEAADPPEPMPLPEFFTLQWHPASRSYAMQMSFARVYPAEGPFSLLEYGAPDETLYLPLDVSEDGASAAVLVYSCVDLPEEFRAAHGIGTGMSLDCEVESAETVRAGLALLDPADAVRLEIALEQPLPDLGG